jgi:hypothetical protein
MVDLPSINIMYANIQEDHLFLAAEKIMCISLDRLTHCYKIIVTEEKHLSFYVNIDI